MRKKNTEPSTNRADELGIEKRDVVKSAPAAGDSTNTNETLLTPEQEYYLFFKGMKRSNSEEEMLRTHLNYLYYNTTQKLKEKNNSNRPQQLNNANNLKVNLNLWMFLLGFVVLVILVIVVLVIIYLLPQK